MLGKMGAFVGLTEAGPAATSTGDAVAAVTGVVTGDADPETQGCPCPFTLTRKQRFHGFFACFGIGMVFSLLCVSDNQWQWRRRDAHSLFLLPGQPSSFFDP